jgi:Subtilase family/Abnormal spindle-like microcephaly-assoc'd, ASPM-SPD-2-Hydin
LTKRSFGVTNGRKAHRRAAYEQAMSPTPRATCALPLLLACVSLGAGACLSPDDAATPEAPATLDEQPLHLDGDEDAAAAPGAAAASTPSASVFATEQKLDFVPGELILTLDKDTKLVAGQAIEAAGVRLMPVRQLASGAWLALLPSAATAHAAIKAGRSLDAAALAAAEQLTLSARDAVTGAPGIQSAAANLVMELSAAPSDPFYLNYQRWHYDAVRMPGAWDYGGGHSGVRLAIIDTETNQNQHPDLALKWGPGFDFSGAPQTYHHGAHVAGIAGGAADGNLGVGVCWGCRLLPYRMSGDFFQIAEALDRASGVNTSAPRAEVINLSLNRQTRLGSSQRMQCSDPDSEPTVVREALARAIARGVTVVVSAGNFADQGPAFPANCPNVISVAAVQPSAPVVVGNPVPTAAGIAAYSNRGSHPDHGAVTLAAPGGGGNGNSQFGSMLPEMPCPPPHVSAFGGTDPFSGTVGVVGPFANYTDPVAFGGYCYRFLSGTSMSAPHVTGTVGLMKSRNSALSPAQAKDILVRTAQTATACPVGTCGAGLLDANAATRYATDAGVPLATATAPSFGSVPVGSQVVANVQLTNTGSANLIAGFGASMQILGGAGMIEFASASCPSGTTCSASFGVGQGATFSLPLRCRPTSAGVIGATLRIPSNRFNPSTGAVDAQLDIPLSCTSFIANPDVTVTPLSLGFGSINVGSTSSAQLVTVRNDGGGTLSVTASESTADYNLTCQSGCSCTAASCTASLTANQSAVLAVTFSPQAPGTRNATLTVATNDPDEPTTNVLLFGNGTQPALEVRPDPLHAGAVHVGSSGTAHGVLYNPGNGTLRITQMSLTGANAGIFGFTCGGRPCAPPFDIAAGTSRSLEIRCTPTHNAPYAANLVIASNAPGGTTSAFVQCQGLAPEIAVTPSGGVAFGTVAVGNTATAQIGIYDVNAGLGTNLSWSATVSPGPYQLACASPTGCLCVDEICYSTSSGGGSLTLSFSPVAGGSAPATLTVISNDPEHPVVSRPITGAGQVWLVREEPVTRWIEVNSGGGATTVRIRNQGPSSVTLQNVHIVDLDAPGDSAYFSFSNSTSVSNIAPGGAATWGISCNSAKVRIATFEILYTVPEAASYRGTVRCSPLDSEPLPEPPGFPPQPPPQEM